MSICFIHLLRSQHYYIHLYTAVDEKLGYVFYSAVTECINCLTILTNFANHYILYSL